MGFYYGIALGAVMALLPQLPNVVAICGVCRRDLAPPASGPRSEVLLGGRIHCHCRTVQPHPTGCVCSQHLPDSGLLDTVCHVVGCTENQAAAVASKVEEKADDHATPDRVVVLSELWRGERILA